jgi:two-component system chemotaxis response regulator CheY
LYFVQYSAIALSADREGRRTGDFRRFICESRGLAISVVLGSTRYGSVSRSLKMAKTILLVDDSRVILMAIEGMLRRDGHKVVKAESAEEALTKLQTGATPNLIITDLNMGAMSGIDLIRGARKLPGMRSTPILLLSAESKREHRDEARSAGATGWIVKPVDVGALMGVVNQVLLTPGLEEAA